MPFGGIYVFYDEIILIQTREVALQPGNLILDSRRNLVKVTVQDRIAAKLHNKSCIFQCDGP